MYSLSCSGDPGIERLKLGTLRSQEITDEGITSTRVESIILEIWIERVSLSLQDKPCVLQIANLEKWRTKPVRPQKILSES